MRGLLVVRRWATRQAVCRCGDGDKARRVNLHHKDFDFDCIRVCTNPHDVRPVLLNATHDVLTVEMKVVTTFHQPSSVAHSLKCTLSPDQLHLIVAKLNTLEVYSAQPEGLRHECTAELYGRISVIRTITRKARLFVVRLHPLKLV